MEVDDLKDASVSSRPSVFDKKILTSKLGSNTRNKAFWITALYSPNQWGHTHQKP